MSSNCTWMLQIGIKIWSPYIVTHVHDRKFTGYCVDILEILAHSLNFSYRFVMPPDEDWGDNHDGNWTGLIGLLQRKEADMSFLLAPSAERSQVADWSVPIDYWYNGVAVRREPHKVAQETAFITPFHWTVYACICTTFVLGVLILFGLVRAERILSSGREHQSSWSLSQITEFLWGSLLSEAIPGRPALTTGSGRAFIGGWCLLTLLLTSCYTCKLTSLLVDVTPPPPFTSLADMTTKENYRWGVLGGGTKLLAFLRDSTNDVEQKLYRGLITFAHDDPDTFSLDPDIHRSKVLSENYAFIGEGTTLERWASENCDISVLPHRVTGLEQYTIFFPKGSSLTNEVSSILLKLEDTGVLAYLRSRWFPTAKDCHGHQSSPTSISLATLQGPLYVAVGGLTLASGILFVELIRKKVVNFAQTVTL